MAVFLVPSKLIPLVRIFCHYSRQLFRVSWTTIEMTAARTAMSTATAATAAKSTTAAVTTAAT